MKLAPTSSFAAAALSLLIATPAARAQDTSAPPRRQPPAPVVRQHPRPPAYQNSFAVEYTPNGPRPVPAHAGTPATPAHRQQGASGATGSTGFDIYHPRPRTGATGNTGPYHPAFPVPHAATGLLGNHAATGNHTATGATGSHAVAHTGPAFPVPHATTGILGNRAATGTAATGATTYHAATGATATPAVTTPATPPPPPTGPGVLNRTTIVLDPAHGGNDNGSRLADNLVEKDVTLDLAFRLRSLLQARGFTVVMTRDADASSNDQSPTLSLDDRAGIANHARAVACLLLHATSAGAGVHLYHSDLAAAKGEANTLPWLTAQAAWVPQSTTLADKLSDSLTRAGLPLVNATASVRPVDSLTCPAIVLELAPKSAGDTSTLTSESYQQSVAQALAAALVFWKQQAQSPERIQPAVSTDSAAVAAAAAPRKPAAPATTAAPAPHKPATGPTGSTAPVRPATPRPRPVPLPTEDRND